MKKCPFCAEEIQDEAIVCRFCGREINTTITRKPKIGKDKLAFPVLVVIVLLSAGWFYFLGPCGTLRVSEGAKTLEDITIKWRGAFSIANNTGRIALSGPILNLQSIKQETQELNLPSCLEPARSDLLESMELSIEGFLAFMSDEEDTTIEEKFRIASNRIELFYSQLLDIQDCAPLCAPGR